MMAHPGVPQGRGAGTPPGPGGRRALSDGWPPIDREDEQLRRFGRIAAVLFIAGSVCAIPSILVREPAPPPTIYLLTALAVASGLVCLAIPWERLSRRWFHALAVAAIVEVALAVGLGDRAFAWFYVFIAIFAAYVFTSRRAIAAHVVLVCAALLLPAVYDPDSANDTLVRGFVAMPVLILAAAIVTYLRECLEANQDAYRRLAARDELTGVGNYRSFREYLAQEIGRHERHGREFALIVADLVRFKDVNEELGHLEGDHVLRRVGHTLAGGVRVQDLVARHGGDEFSVIAPETGSRGAAELAIRIEQAVGEISVDGRAVRALTGWAVFPGDGTTPDDLLRKADRNLRLRKREDHVAERAS